MPRARVIARLDIKGSRLIKGIHLEGWKFFGDPKEFSRKYYEAGVDEIIYLDAVASLYNREMLQNLVAETAKNVFVPITAGGGVRSLSDAGSLLRVGADKIAVNTGAVKDPRLITAIAEKFGAQCMVISIEAKKTAPGKWEAYIDSGREPSGLDAVVWARDAVSRGAGEILLTSVDRDGTGQGFDLELARAVTAAVTVPVIASGGIGGAADFVKAISEGGADAVAIARAFHRGELTPGAIREAARAAGIATRES